MKKPTESQVAALDSFERLAREKDSPTIVEWSDFDGRGYTAIHSHRRALLGLGLLEHEPGRTRSTRITERGKRVLRRWRASTSKS